MTAPRPQTVRAYSLVEMIVVVAIIALLLALAGVGANSIINSRRVSATELTMQTLETAIQEFEKDRPVEATEIAAGVSYGPWFNHLPPSPVTPFKPSVVVGAELPPANEELSRGGAAPFASVETRFAYLIQQYLQGAPIPILPPPVVGKDHYASIECLVLFLTQFSPRAKAIIDKLPESCKDNQDKDQAVFSTGRPPIDLIEIKDSWDKPLRWTVMPLNQDVVANRGLPVRWELRSAGKDGEFSPPFTPADRSDDVVWPKGSSR